MSNWAALGCTRGVFAILSQPSDKEQERSYRILHIRHCP